MRREEADLRSQNLFERTSHPQGQQVRARPLPFVPPHLALTPQPAFRLESSHEVFPHRGVDESVSHDGTVRAASSFATRRRAPLSPPPSDPPDADPNRLLIERIQKGEDKERNFEQLYRLYYERVFRFFIRRGFTACESDELTQDTLLRVYRNIESFQHGSRFERWLFIVAINVYRNEIRRRRAEKRDLPELSLDDDEVSASTLMALASPDSGPLDNTLRKERSDALRTAVDELPKQMRRCVLFRVYHMLKYREIADLMGISIESVKAHLHQAQARLRIALLDASPAGTRRSGEDDGSEPVAAVDPRQPKDFT
jgi:RNA polymerase sigma-70 factor (ECF subfamily)